MPSISRSSSSTSHLKRNESSNLNSPSSTSISSSDPRLTTTPDGSSDSSDDTKFKQLLTVLKKAIGVKDMGAMRLSLPANLITPIGNLEYWCYLDRPDVFAAIDDSDDDFERMLAVLRWTLTKDCKFIHGPVCKPYNSVLGEQFRCMFDIIPPKVDPESGVLHVYETPSRSNSPIDPDDSTLKRSASFQTTSSSTHQESEDPGLLRNSYQSHASLATTVNKPGNLTRVVFLNEQVSHHPPISCFWYEARPKLDGQTNSQVKPRVIAHGVDQISAKFTGTSVKVFPGPMNKGIYVKLPNRSEEYEITHPTATVSGLIRASPYVVITDHTYITCRSSQKRRFRTIINYIDESWVGKAKFALEGVIYELREDEDPDEWTKIKQVPNERIWCKISGSWRGVVTYKMMSQASSRRSTTTDEEQDDRRSSTDKNQAGSSRELIDLSNLLPLSKTVKPESNQDEMESRRFWNGLTSLIKSKNYGEATKVKQSIEQHQRDLSSQRKSSNQTFKPIIFRIDEEDDHDDRHEDDDAQDNEGGGDDGRHQQPNDELPPYQTYPTRDGYLKFSKPKLTEQGLKILEAEFKGIGYEKEDDSNSS